MKAILVTVVLILVFAPVLMVQAGTWTKLDAGPDQTVTSGLVVYFSGSISGPYNIELYTWDFGDGSPVVSGTNPSILTDTIHVYVAPSGTVFTATLTVEINGVYTMPE